MAIQARTEFASALNQLASEKGVDSAVVIEAIQQAALAAYRKDLSLRGEEIPEDFEELVAHVDPVTGEISILREEKNITPPGFARIAAQTAKQVIMQKLHEAEKSAISEEYEKRVGTVVSGTVQRQEGNTYFVDLGRAEGVFPVSEQIRDEYYHPGQRLKFYIKEIREGRRGPEVVVSRNDADLVKGLFALEVPEISAGSVVVKDVAREAGNRTKIAAISTVDGVDPVGSLVGQKGVRVQAVMNELGEEKIDIISYSDDPARYIAAALSPAKDVTVNIIEEGDDKVAKVTVPSRSMSLAIGKGGQNVRLAAKLTGWKIDIEGTGEDVAEVGEGASAQPQPTIDDKENKEGREAVVEGVEQEIDKAEEEEAIVDAGAVQEPDAEEAKEAVVQAEADIAAEDKVSEKEKLAQGEGSLEETDNTRRDDTIAFDRPDENEAPTVANTSETPDVSSVEPEFPGEGPSEANDERLEKDEVKQGPTVSYVSEEDQGESEEDKKQE